MIWFTENRQPNDSDKFHSIEEKKNIFFFFFFLSFVPIRNVANECLLSTVVPIVLKYFRYTEETLASTVTDWRHTHMHESSFTHTPSKAQCVSESKPYFFSHLLSCVNKWWTSVQVWEHKQCAKQLTTAMKPHAHKRTRTYRHIDWTQSCMDWWDWNVK